MARDGVGGEHGVLVRSERGEPVLDEAPQRPSRLRPGRGEQAWPVPSDEGDVPVALPPVEVVTDFVVDVVLAGPVRAAGLEGSGLAGWGFPVVVIEVPPSCRGLLAVHEQVVAATDPAVEVLLPQALAVVSVRPGGEVGHRHQKPARRAHRHLVEGPHEAEGRVRGRVVDAERTPTRRSVQPLPVGVCPYVRDAVAQFRRAVAHRGQHEVGLGPVEATPAEVGARLDHEQGSVETGSLFARGEEVGAELVAEGPVHDVSPQSRPRACLKRASPSARSMSGSG
ncbi:yjeF protein [Streptomyces laurentii]|uniref:YjeF protein n=1 Tax=Streptomyces laurentii TaxID=39478 RepID=A0A160P4L9_STRLU|nr:yjeF protein [Streptomyces laurentii]